MLNKLDVFEQILILHTLVSNIDLSIAYQTKLLYVTCLRSIDVFNKVERHLECVQLSWHCVKVELVQMIVRQVKQL